MAVNATARKAFFKKAAVNKASSSSWMARAAAARKNAGGGDERGTQQWGNKQPTVTQDSWLRNAYKNVVGKPFNWATNYASNVAKTVVPGVAGVAANVVKGAVGAAGYLPGQVAGAVVPQQFQAPQLNIGGPGGGLSFGGPTYQKPNAWWNIPRPTVMGGPVQRQARSEELNRYGVAGTVNRPYAYTPPGIGSLIDMNNTLGVSWGIDSANGLPYLLNPPKTGEETYGGGATVPYDYTDYSGGGGGGYAYDDYGGGGGGGGYDYTPEPPSWYLEMLNWNYERG